MFKTTLGVFVFHLKHLIHRVIADLDTKHWESLGEANSRVYVMQKLMQNIHITYQLNHKHLCI